MVGIDRTKLSDAFQVKNASRRRKLINMFNSNQFLRVRQSGTQPAAKGGRSSLREWQLTKCLLANCFECHHVRHAILKLSKHRNHSLNTVILSQVYRALIDPKFN